MTSLWTSADLEAATLGKAGSAFTASGISIDSRTLQPGDLYIAIIGENHDGHAFVGDALSKGAAGALVSHQPDGVGKDAPLVMVAHAQRGLEDVGRAGRTRFTGQIAAITGSVGKTTLKEMLRLALGANGETHAAGGSLNNHWGVPLTLAALPPRAAYGVIEIGMNHFGEIRALNAQTRPHLAVITTIAPAHLEFFGNQEAICDAKSEIFEGLLPGGTALLPADHALYPRMMARAKQAGVTHIMGFGETSGDARLTAYDEDNAGAKIEADICGQPVRCLLDAPGRHNAMAAVAALASTHILGGDVLAAAAALKGFAALKGRGARLRLGAVTVIDESYNANPSSMRAALSLLDGVPGRRIVVLGDMLELGAEADALHAGLADAVLACDADAVFLCGPHMQALWQALPKNTRGAWAADSLALASMVTEEIRADDVVLIKGSNGSKMSVVIDAIKKRVG